MYTPGAMRREFLATVDDVDVSVTFERLADGTWRVDADDHTHHVDAREVRPGTWSLIVNGRSIVVDLDERTPVTAVTHGAHEFLVDMDDAQRKRLSRAVASRSTASAKGELIRAPIAGKVVKVLVATGETVAAGHGVTVLEAMKMENEIKAERGGVVSAIHVIEGQSVETRDTLVTLE